ncbi:MAG: hypothetical protein JXB35_16785 [Anaerolineae bacterium]|nr:hypothetical protein [Anaerolineae bacterium]
MQTFGILEIAFIFVILAIIALVIVLILVLTGSRKSNTTSVSVSSSAPSARRAARGADDVLRVRVNDLGVWEVSVHGVVYRDLTSVPDPKVQQEVVNAIKILAAFSRDYIQKQRAAEKPPVGSSPPRAGVPIGPLPKLAPEEERLRIPLATPSLIPQIDLAREIGEILEDLQKRSPSLAKRSISLLNAVSGGVEFLVDGNVYTSVEEIPDLEVQALIRTATREWERRS